MIELIGMIGFGTLVLYYLATIIIADMPSLGYFMTFPVRIALPIMSYHTYGSVEGLLIGAGLALILSFERSVFWKIGVLLLFASELCHTTV